MRVFFFLIFSIVISLPAAAEIVELEYKSFYSHVRKLNDESMNLLQFSFGLQHIDSGKLCQIENAHISTQKQQIPVEVSDENRFTVPQERALRLADAKVILSTVEPANKCDMSVQLETRADQLKSNYASEELVTLLTQYTAFFEDMGGFFSFMMPQVTGLVLHFEKGLFLDLGNGLKIENGRLEVEEGKLTSIQSLDLPEKPLRITALTQSS